MTKKLLPLAVFILAQYVMSTPAYAHKTIAACEKNEQTPAKLSRCLDEVKNTLDRELQTWVNNHLFNLEEAASVTGRYAALKMFKRSQNNFTTFRENTCRWQYLTISPDKEAEMAYKKCYIRVTKNRINELSLVK